MLLVFKKDQISSVRNKNMPPNDVILSPMSLLTTIPSTCKKLLFLKGDLSGLGFFLIYRKKLQVQRKCHAQHSKRKGFQAIGS